jgi:hypothetical protein
LTAIDNSNPLNDGKLIAKDALTGLQTLFNNILNEVSAEVPKLSGDALEVANNFVTKGLSHAGPLAGIVNGMLQSGEALAKGQIDTKGVALLTIFKTDVDSALGHLIGKVS